MKIVVVLPTYNERENIINIVTSIFNEQIKFKNDLLSILVVDDNSPDGTGKVVDALSKFYNNLHLLRGNKHGLGRAYLRGFRHAIEKLRADAVIEMDADLSHNPKDIVRLVNELKSGYDIVIGSRYVKGGKIPADWSLLRRLNSKTANFISRTFAGLDHINDATGGFRIYKKRLLKKVLDSGINSTGYVFQVSVLNAANNLNASIKEIPITFRDRIYGKSKININVIVEFLIEIFKIKLKTFPKSTLLTSALIISTIIMAFIFLFIGFTNFIILIVLAISTLLITQSLFSIYWMIYAWEYPERVELNKSPKNFKHPTKYFTALIPARNEEKVISDTMKAVDNIKYPDYLKETIIICHSSDTDTISKVQETINELNKENIKLVTYFSNTINKPRALNEGLKEAKGGVIAVFDAEDEANPDIYNVINTIMLNKSSDVVQSGVQLINYKSRWFSILNVMEYYFWFKSTLQFFANQGSIPLGGNTVFFNKKLLRLINGWDEKSLTEDADIGIRLSSLGVKIDTVYDEIHATKEETPLEVSTFIRQRSRWNQGFLQILMKGDWLKLPTARQKLLILYVLIWPQFQAMLLIYLPVSLLIILFKSVPVVVALIAVVPFLLFIIQIVVLNIGLYEFIKDYKFKYRLSYPLIIFFTFIPYQILLGISAYRAIFRLLNKNLSWEKTEHTNAHRENFPLSLKFQYFK